MTPVDRKVNVHNDSFTCLVFRSLVGFAFV